MKRYYVALAALSLFIIFVIGWSQYTRFVQFNSYHKIISQHTTHTVASSVQDLLLQKEHLIKLFLEHYGSSIQHIITEPENPTRLDYLTDEIHEHFPNYFAFTIADQYGKPVIEDIESQVGSICRQELQSYVATGSFQPRIHPTPYAYHYDVLQPFHIDGKPYIFFLSFHAEELGHIITTSQAPSHLSYLVLPQQDDKLLLEVLSSGARNTISRDSYLLTDEEKERIIVSKKITGTRWNIIDSYSPELYSEFMFTVIKDSLLYLTSYIIIVSILFIYLLSAEKKKRLAEQHKNEFLSIVSHELRTPLTAIMGSLGLATNFKQDEYDKSQKLLHVAYKHTQRLATLVNDILDVQKMEAGKMVYDMQEMDLFKLLHESIEGIASYASENQAVVSMGTNAESIAIIGDHARLMQVMNNLLSNAIKYGARGDTIIVSSTVMDNGFVRVSVSDHGDGIAKDFQTHLFEKFTQADASTTRSVSGTGLGLSIVKSIIKAHQGSVGFYTAEKKGTSFYFDLPLLS